MHVIDLDTWRNSREAETGAESKDIPMTSSRSTVHGPTHIPTDGAVGACGASSTAVSMAGGGADGLASAAPLLGRAAI